MRIMIDDGLQKIINEFKTKNITLNIDETEDKTLFLNKLQEINNKLYEKYDLTDEVLKLQVWINTKRNEYNITDTSEVIHTDKDGKNFVQ